MIYYTGDIHGSADELVRFCISKKLQQNDVVILLGDVGANYYGGKRDQRLKEIFAGLAPTFLCIHGNHEMRPETVGVIFKKNGAVVLFGMKQHIRICYLQRIGKYTQSKVFAILQSAGLTASINITD